MKEMPEMNTAGNAFCLGLNSFNYAEKELLKATCFRDTVPRFEFEIFV